MVKRDKEKVIFFLKSNRKCKATLLSWEELDELEKTARYWVGYLGHYTDDKNTGQYALFMLFEKRYCVLINT